MIKKMNKILINTVTMILFLAVSACDSNPVKINKITPDVVPMTLQATATPTITLVIPSATPTIFPTVSPAATPQPCPPAKYEVTFLDF
jgi:hypothetical protein